VTKIERIEVLAVAPDVPTFRYTEHAPPVTTTTTVLRLIDADGAEGAGAYDSDTHGVPDRAPLERLRSIVPRLIGLDAEDRVAIAALLTEGGTLPWPPTVASAVEIAAWDLAARRAEVPLVRFLGTDRATPLPAYASIELFDDPGAYLDAITRLTSRGFTAAKVHAWGEPTRDIDLLERIREAFPDLVLMHDAEGRYDREGARRVTDAAARLGLRWLEAPLPDLDLEGYRALRERGVPIFPAGDAVWDARLLRELMRDPPWDAVRFDVSFVGGVGAALALGEVARDLDLPIEPIAYGHTLIQAANLHVLLALGRSAFVELPVPAEPWEHGVRTTVRIDREGLVPVPVGPGLGIDVDWDAMRDAAVATLP
jgi:L-alanine-DL-glutamate epimerase-like enolase superfamily enzyme